MPKGLLPLPQRALWCSIVKMSFFIFSSESVGEGHPDKVADAISDAVLDACLAQDPHSRVAVETLVKDSHVVLAGELTTKAKINAEEIVRQTIREIGYTYDDCRFHADRVDIVNYISAQSPDIARGVDLEGDLGAGDQGSVFGYACNETEELMPAAIMYAHAITQRLQKIRSHNLWLQKFPQVGYEPQCLWLRPDCKSQVALRYEDGKPVEAAAIVCSTQHAQGIEHKEIERFVRDEVIKNSMPADLLTKNTKYFINPTGRFVIGGPEGDAGLTGRKIIVDTYGGAARHGGGAFSGKDPSKVDRSAAYMCRWVAKNVVAAELATRCELQVSYAIGHPEPVSVMVETFGTAKAGEEKIAEAIRKVFSFKPAEIIRQLDLLKPIYRQTTNYGHFGKRNLPWEMVNKVDELKKNV